MASCPTPYTDVLRHPSLKQTPANVLVASAAPGTWQTRRRVMKLVASAGSPAAALDRVLALQVTNGTKAKYISVLKWAMTRSDLSMLADAATALRKTAKTSETKALPLSKAMLKSFLANPHAAKTSKAILAKAFATASRIDEVVKIDVQTHKGLTVFSRSKTNQQAAARIDHIWLAEDTGDILRPWIQMFDNMTYSRRKARSTLERLRKDLKEMPVSDKYRRKFQQWDPRNNVRRTLTFHSAKRGAAMYLWSAAARGRLTPTQVAHALKHKSTESSLKYAPRPVDVAKAYHSQDMAAELRL